jgi:mono/diheme cytochrome c family protein
VKACIAALSTMGIVLGASLAQGTQEKEPRYKYKKDGLVYAEIAKAPEKARAKRNPLEKDPDAVAAGANLFEQHCAECHGNTAEGGKKGPSLRAPEVQNAAPGAIFWILTNGVVRRGMPVWSKLPEPQRWQLVSYIKSLGAVSTEVTNPPSTNPTPTATPSPRASSLPRH